MSKTASLARKATKATVLPAGALTRRRSGDTVILLYHRTGAGNREIDLAAGVFERQMKILSMAANAVTLDAALTHGGVVVTVDDGYRDFYDHALPALVAHRVPTLIYVATEHIGTNGSESLSWRHLQEAAGTGLVAVGAHTHSHADLSQADRRFAEDEMRRSKGLIEEHLGIGCRHFAYPWGVASPDARAVARELFETAALRWGINRKGAIDRYNLGRTPVLRSDGPFLFRAKANGMLDGEAFIYRLLRRGPWRKS
jgi:hypothetical protein